MIIITITIIAIVITIVIFLIRVKFKLTYIFYTQKNNVGLFVFEQSKHYDKQHGLDMLLVGHHKTTEECFNCKCTGSGPH